MDSCFQMRVRQEETLREQAQQRVAWVLTGVRAEDSCIGQGWSFCRRRRLVAAVLDKKTAGSANYSKHEVALRTAGPAS
jgi:hypothetical protein